MVKQATAQEQETAPEAAQEQEIAQATTAEAAPAPPETCQPAPAPELPEAVIATPAVAQAPAPEPDVAPSSPIAERRHPLRFVWHMDADGRFGVGSDEFVELVGPRTMAAFGRLWSEIADRTRSSIPTIRSRAPWRAAKPGAASSCPGRWTNPASDCRSNFRACRYSIATAFRGYRGFGVCRDIGRINKLARARHDRPLGFMPRAGEMPQQGADAAPAAAPPAESAGDRAGEPARSRELRPTSTAAVRRRRRRARPMSCRSANPRRRTEVPPRSESGRAHGLPRTGAGTDRAACANRRQPADRPKRGREDRAGGEPCRRPRRPPPRRAGAPSLEQMLLDRLPIGILIYRDDALLYANRHFLDWSGLRKPRRHRGGRRPRTGCLPARAEPRARAASGAADRLSSRPKRRRFRPKAACSPCRGAAASALALVLTNGRGRAARRASEARARRRRERNPRAQSIARRDGRRRRHARRRRPDRRRLPAPGPVRQDRRRRLSAARSANFWPRTASASARDYLDRFAAARQRSTTAQCRIRAPARTASCRSP